MKSINFGGYKDEAAKKELNRYHFALQQCIRSRKEWNNRIRWKKLRQKVSYHMIFPNSWYFSMDFKSTIFNLKLDMQKLSMNLKKLKLK